MVYLLSPSQCTTMILVARGCAGRHIPSALAGNAAEGIAECSAGPSGLLLASTKSGGCEELELTGCFYYGKSQLLQRISTHVVDVIRPRLPH